MSGQGAPSHVPRGEGGAGRGVQAMVERSVEESCMRRETAGQLHVKVV